MKTQLIHPKVEKVIRKKYRKDGDRFFLHFDENTGHTLVSIPDDGVEECLSSIYPQEFKDEVLYGFRTFKGICVLCHDDENTFLVGLPKKGKGFKN